MTTKPVKAVIRIHNIEAEVSKILEDFRTEVTAESRQGPHPWYRLANSPKVKAASDAAKTATDMVFAKALVGLQGKLLDEIRTAVKTSVVALTLR